MASEQNLLTVAIFITLGTVAYQATSKALYEASIAEKYEQRIAKYERIYRITGYEFVTLPKANKPAAKITGYEFVPSNSENDLLKAVSMPPVSVLIDSSGPWIAFQHYESGVFSGDCGTNLIHTVAAIGYGTTDDGTKYWLLKNCWGEGWGENGYMRILRDASAPEGLCGIAIAALHPVA